MRVADSFDSGPTWVLWFLLALVLTLLWLFSLVHGAVVLVAWTITATIWWRNFWEAC